LNKTEEKLREIKYLYYYRGEKKEKYMSVDDIFVMIRDGKYARQCDFFAQKAAALALNGEKSMPDNEEKLPSVVFGQTQGNRYTGYIVMSFKCTDKDEALAKMRVATHAPHTLMTFRSASRQTLVVVAAYVLPDGTVPAGGDEAVYFNQHAYYSASLYYKALLGLDIDMSAPHVDRSCMMTSDTEAYLNMHLLPMIQEQPSCGLDEAMKRNMVKNIANVISTPSAEVKNMPKEILPGYDSYHGDMTKFHFCYAATMEEGHDEVDDFCLALAGHCQRNGLGQEFAVKRLMMYPEYKRYETMVRRCFNNVYCHPTSRTELSIPMMTIEMRRMRDFLDSHYRLRRNAITGAVEYIEEGMFMFDWKPLTKEIVNRMTIIAIDEGINIWDKDIKRYLESPFVNEYDPIAEYMNALPAWDGYDRVSEMAAKVPTDNENWQRNFHIWMLSMVSQWTGHNRMHGATMVPLLIGSQGDGKSTFCRMILPEELREYYTDRLDFTNRNDAERALTRFALINIDEYDSITPRQGAFLKHILQKSSVMSRDMYQSLITERRRYCAFIGTTNDPSPLTDTSGSRRYLCIRTNGKIDITSSMDYAQLYAQLKQEMNDGVKSYFDNEDEAAIQQQNLNFQDFDVVGELFAQLYRKPDKDEEGTFMTVMEICHQLRQESIVVKEDHSTCVKIGKMLKMKGFEQRRANVGSKYRIIQVAEK
jgi:hypothetical protein